MTLFPGIIRVGAGILLATALATSANSIPIEPTVTSDYRLFVSNDSPNTLGIATGGAIVFGAAGVSPDGLTGGTTGLATTFVAGSPVTFDIPALPSPQFPSAMLGRTPYDANLVVNPWTITFTNGGLSNVSSPLTVPAYYGTAAPLPFLASVKVAGTPGSPTFSWTPPPASTHVDAYNIAVFDRSAATGTGKLFDLRMPAGTTSRTITAADFAANGFAFDLTHKYTIGLSYFETRTKNTTFGGLNVYNQSNVYFDWTPSAVTSSGVYLPVTLPDGSFKFDIPVVAGTTYYLDPALAVGYDFQIGAGDPKFASVVLPTGVGDNLFDIFGFDSLNNPLLLAEDWLGGVVFDFGPGGVDRFRVLGIEIAAGLDPADTSAFVTGLTFVSDGTFTGTQTPITVNVPEPDTILLFGAGIAGLFGFRTTRRRVDV